nr:hypothetical protein [Tanacetum cinerariifolium]
MSAGGGPISIRGQPEKGLGPHEIWEPPVLQEMEMQNFISSSDLLCWNIVLKDNSAKSMTTDKDGNLKIRPPVTAEEHQQVQREEKARTILISALPDEHMGLEYISFDDLYSKLKFLEIDTKGYSLSSSTLSYAAFVSTAGSSKGKLSYQESRNGGYGGYTTTLSASPGSSSSKDQQLVYEDLNHMNKEEFEEYDLKHQMEMLSIKVHRFEKKHGRKIKFNGRENARFDKKLVKCFNCKKIGYFSKECQAQGGQNGNNYQKYKEVGKDGTDSKAMVVVDGSIDWDKQTEEGNTEPRSLENFGMDDGLEIASDADSEGEVVSADDAIAAGVSVSAGDVADAIVSPHSKTEFSLMGLSTELAYEEKIRVLSYELEEKSNILEYRQKLIDQATQEKQDLMTKLDNELANQAKWNNNGELGIDDSKFSIFHTTSDELEGPPIYNRFALVDHMKAVPPPLTGNYMPPSNIPDIDESQMVYGKKATDSSKTKTNDDSITHSNDSVLFYFSDRSSEPSTNDLKMCDSSVECSRPNYSDHDSNDSIFSVSASASESRDTIVIDCARQEDFTSVCTSSTKTDVKSSNTFCQKNAKGKGILKSRPTGKPVNPNRKKPVSAGRPKPVFAGRPNPVSAGRPNPVSANQPNQFLLQIIFPINHNSLYSLYMTGGLNGKTVVKPSTGWPWTKYGMSKIKGSKINGGSKSKSWSYAKGPLGRPKLEMTWVPKEN